MDRRLRGMQIAILLVYLLSLTQYWLGFDKGVDAMRGWQFLLGSPFAIIALIFVAAGIFRKTNMYIIIGAALLIVVEVAEFLLFPTHISSGMDLSLSMQETFFGFYISCAISVLLLISGCIKRKNNV